MRILKKRGLIGGLLSLLVLMGCSQQGEVLNEERLATAIFYSEGGDRTNYPYGIKSVSCETKDECRIKCLESIRNNEKRFARHGGKGVEDFIRFMSRRYVYCGFGECQARIDWQKNVKEIYYGRK
jgi:hypothetical protein